MNNLKIYISKKICDKIKSIDLRNQEKDDNYIIADLLQKKSDSNYSWEE
jgi:hypothetical protein